MQKLPAQEFTATTKVTFTPRATGEKTGLILMGLDYAYLSIKKASSGLVLTQRICKNAADNGVEKETAAIEVTGSTFFLRVKVSKGARADFSYSSDGTTFRPIGEPFQAREGRWIGAKIGIFAVADSRNGETGYADYDWFRME
jgi:beta-xylosidase